MRIALLSLLFACCLVARAAGSGAVTVRITTTDSEVTYSLHPSGWSEKGQIMKPDEIESWIRANRKLASELVIVYPDERTSFKTVLELLRRIKSAGVRMFSIVIPDGSTAYSLSGETGKIWETSGVKPPKK
jgi:biopolymer transport protein ExbD